MQIAQGTGCTYTIHPSSVLLQENSIKERVDEMGRSMPVSSAINIICK